MYDSDDKIEKKEVKVEIMLDDGRELHGAVFVNQTQRLSDLLNDTRQFLPVRLLAGRMEYIRKDIIGRVAQSDLRIDLDKLTDPYEILGVAKDIADDDLRTTYHELCKQNHPDKLSSLGLAREITIYTNGRLRRIIEAYREIMIERHGALDDDQLEEAA